jgi:hypothetical protein
MASPGKGARLKGHNFEREVAHLLTEDTGIPFKRGLGQTRAGASEYPDVYTPVLKDIHIECKRQIRCNIKEAIRQGKYDIKSSLQDRSLVVISKDDREEMLVTMPYRDWIVLFNAYLSNRLANGEGEELDASLQEQSIPEKDYTS